MKGFYTMAEAKFYTDELYLFVTRVLIFRYISRPVAWFDRHVVDGTMNLIGNSAIYIAGYIRKVQSGELQLYMWFFTTGALLLTLIMMYLVRKPI